MTVDLAIAHASGNSIIEQTLATAPNGESTSRSKVPATSSCRRAVGRKTSDEFTIILEANGEIRKISLECVTGLPDVEVIR